MSCEARICREILKDDFGQYPATIADLLILKGRLSLSDLIRISRYTPKLVRECLIVLIQHGIVFFSETADVEKNEATYYEADPGKIMMRLRMGRIMRITEEHYGKAVSSSCSYMYRLKCLTACL
ncbi:hypothetical protein BD408DRAFT_191254 [Parasitella parasitica]|nr:hypothetical protein BD408DRAFT_191254 [Parasitella parasitica]